MLLWGPDSLLLRPVPQIPEKMDKQFNPLEKRIFYDSFVRSRQRASFDPFDKLVFIYLFFYQIATGRLLLQDFIN
jgi:hypothetical protein